MKIKSRFAFGGPLVTLSIGVVAYLVIIPNICGKEMLSKQRLLLDLENAISILHNPNTILIKLKSMDGVQLFWFLWLLAFIASLFFFCKQLHLKTELRDVDAIYTKKELYLMIQGVRIVLVQIKEQRKSKELGTLIYDLKCIEEKLSVESEFGYGGKSVLDCENRIAEQMQLLSEIVVDIDTEDFDANVDTMNSVIININSLLQKRTELKKK